MLGVLALLACAPTQLHMAQHGLIDGVFAFSALTCCGSFGKICTGRTLVAGKSPTRRARADGFDQGERRVCLAGVKRSAPGDAWRAGWGKVSRRLVLTHFAGALFGGAILISLAGGLPECLAIYALLKAKAQSMPFRHQDRVTARGSATWLISCALRRSHSFWRSDDLCSFREKKKRPCFSPPSSP